MDWRTYQKKQEQNYPVKKEKTIIQYNTYTDVNKPKPELNWNKSDINSNGLSDNIGLNSFVFELPNALPKEFCKQVIDKFEKDDRKEIGITEDGLRIDVKQSEDLQITGYDDWKEEDEVFFNSLGNGVKKYASHLTWPYNELVNNYESADTGYQIQKTKPGDGYSWHHDQIGSRRHTFIWYLNDIHEKGYTELSTGYKIQPEAGKFIIFPALWPWLHRGFPPESETKYICTGWIHQKGTFIGGINVEAQNDEENDDFEDTSNSEMQWIENVKATNVEKYNPNDIIQEIDGKQIRMR